MVIFFSTEKYFRPLAKNCETAAIQWIKVRVLLQTFASFWTHRAQNQNLFFGEPPHWVDDSKNIWVAQFHRVYRAFWVFQQQIPHNYKRESLIDRASFLRDRWSNQDIWYTKSTQNFMEIDMTRPDFPNFASPLNNKGRELPGRTL